MISDWRRAKLVDLGHTSSSWVQYKMFLVSRFLPILIKHKFRMLKKVCSEFHSDWDTATWAVILASSFSCSFAPLIFSCFSFAILGFSLLPLVFCLSLLSFFWFFQSSRWQRLSRGFFRARLRPRSVRLCRSCSCSGSGYALLSFCSFIYVCWYKCHDSPLWSILPSARCVVDCANPCKNFPCAAS